MQVTTKGKLKKMTSRVLHYEHYVSYNENNIFIDVHNIEIYNIFDEYGVMENFDFFFCFPGWFLHPTVKDYA